MGNPWYLLNDHNKFVYHYTRASTALRYILPHATLRFSSFEHVNDPRESKQWNFSFLSDATEIHEDIRALSAKINLFIKNNYSVCCFVSDIEEAAVNALTRNLIPAMYDRGHSRPRMWAQYAQNFAGVCLVFDKARLDQAFTLWAKANDCALNSGRVAYQNMSALPNLNSPGLYELSIDEIRRIGIEAALGRHLSHHRKRLFFTKSKDWSQECEFRWLLATESSNDKYLPFADALVGVAIGDKFSRTNRRALGRLLLNRDVSIAEINWNNGTPQPTPLHPRVMKTM